LFNNSEKLITDEFNHKWSAYRHAADAAGIPPITNPEILESLKQVFAFSDFVAESCTRNPAVLIDLIDSGDLLRRRQPNDYDHKLKALLADVSDEETLSRLLRRYRRRELVRIAWRDLSGWADLSETVSDLSAFADACLEHVLNTLYQWQCRGYGTPTAADGSKQRLAILGLGKLGARELNFSSDVDLIFAYPKAGDARGAKESLSNDEFFSRLCRRLIKGIGQPTADGFVPRVDARLRPFGESGPLAMDFEAMEQYYQQQGREWERYALIKARVVAGDKDAGAFLLDRLHPFIYRRYLDYSVFESLREMKQMIALEVKRKGMENNIKLGAGGIREIEFFGQIFQLIRGGVNPALQNTGILKVLNTLADERHVPQEVCDELIKAYVFLRNTENRLQAFSDQQTHKLPADDHDQLRLAVSMGFPATESFNTALKNHREIVHGHFQMLLESGDTNDRHKNIEDPSEVIWQNPSAGQQAGNMLGAMGYDRPHEVIKLLDYLKNDPETRALSSRGRRRLDQLVPRFLKEIGTTKNPLIYNFTENAFGNLREIVAHPHQWQGAADIGRRHTQNIDLFENAQLFDLVLQVIFGYLIESPAQGIFHFDFLRRQIKGARVKQFIQQHRMPRQKRCDPGTSSGKYHQMANCRRVLQ